MRVRATPRQTKLAPLVHGGRRHLDETQRAAVAAKIANMKLGDNQHQKLGRPIDRPSDAPPISNTQAAKVSAKIANVRAGEFHGNQHTKRHPQICGLKTSQAEAAEMLNVSESAAALSRRLR